MRGFVLKEIKFFGLERDDIGRVFLWENRVFRAINYEAVERIKEIFSSGMIDDLISNNLFPKSWITDYTLDGYGLVLEHEKINIITYPYEWSFSMLKDAAITVLKVNLIARKYGFQTNDAHGYNVLFNGTQPMFVDFGSFIQIEKKSTGWIGYGEFIRFFYYPLQIWSGGNSYIARKILLRPNEIIPHYSYLLYKNPFLRLLSVSFLERVVTLYYSYRSISVYSSKVIKDRFPGSLGDLIVYLRAKRVLPFQSVNFLSLIKKTQRLSKKKHKTPWSDYHNKFCNEDEKLKSSPRFDRIINIIKSCEIKSVLDLASNQGVFSRLLLERTSVENVISADYDENAVDLMYSTTSTYKIKKLTPVLFNFIFPIMNDFRILPSERFKSDAVIALAVTHHLILTQNIPIDIIFQTFVKNSKRYVFVEFMPLGRYSKGTAPPIPAWYTIGWFRKAFKKYFHLLLEEQLEKNRILFWGELKE